MVASSLASRACSRRSASFALPLGGSFALSVTRSVPSKLGSAAASLNAGPTAARMARSASSSV